MVGIGRIDRADLLAGGEVLAIATGDVLLSGGGMSEGGDGAATLSLLSLAGVGSDMVARR